MRSPQHCPLLLAVLTIGTLLGSPPVGVLHSQTLHPPTRAASAPSARGLVLNGGEWHRDLEGVIGTARLELSLAGGERWLVVPGLTYAHYTFGSPTQIDVFAPEVLIHLQLSRGSVRPYVGAGAGLSLIHVMPHLRPGAHRRHRVTDRCHASVGRAPGGWCPLLWIRSRCAGLEHRHCPALLIPEVGGQGPAAGAGGPPVDGWAPKHLSAATSRPTRRLCWLSSSAGGS